MTIPVRGSPSRTTGSLAGHILVVDDETDFRHTLLRCLEGTEFRGVGAASAAEAIQAVRNSHPRAILLDWALPGGIDGFAVLKALKADPSTRHIPIIMISGLKRSPAERQAVQRAGAEGLITKDDLTNRRENFLGLLRGAVAKNTSPTTWRLLVVEDDADVQEFIRFSLARREFDVHFSSAGRPACRMAQDLQPNLILLDMGLPDINGIEVSKLLRANPETKNIPILAMSAMARTAGVLESALRELGIEDYMPKPFGENELIQHVSQLLERGRSKKTPVELLERGRVRIDVNARRVWVGERLIEHVGFKQFDLLHVLIKNADGVSRTRLQSLIWSGTENPKALNMTVSRLRKTLGFMETEGIVLIPHGYKLVG